MQFLKVIIFLSLFSLWRVDAEEASSVTVTGQFQLPDEALRVASRQKDTIG